MAQRIPELNAPIVPGKSAAGILIGTEIGDLLDQAQPTAMEQLSSAVRYQFGSVVRVWIRHDIVDQVGVYVGYVGLLENKIGIGSTVAEIEDWCGCQVEEDEEDKLIAPGKPGWCFDTEAWVGDRTVFSNRNAVVNMIFVFAAKEQKVVGSSGWIGV